MTKHKLVLLLILVSITIATIFYILFGIASEFVSGILHNVVVLIMLFTISTIVIMISTTIILTTDNKYAVAIAAIAVFVSSIVLVATLSQLINIASDYLNKVFENISKRIIGS